MTYDCTNQATRIDLAIAALISGSHDAKDLVQRLHDREFREHLWRHLRDAIVEFEVALEFEPLIANQWSLIERWNSGKIARGFKKLAAVRDWQRSTKWGRDAERAKQRARDALAKTQLVRVACALCGSLFHVQQRTIKRSKKSKRVCVTCRTRNSIGIPVTIGDKTKTLTEWARSYGLNPSTVFYRIKRGLSVREALEEPLNGRGRKEDAS
jgi:hypothetical protein